MAIRGQVDFSSKHDIYLHRKDGSYMPMDEPCYEVEKIADNTWQIMSSGDYHYLVAGEEEGIAIDTGYGAGNLRDFLEKLCRKPVRSVINTHHHFDHSANNCYFDRAYMAAEAIGLVSRPYVSFAGMDFFPDSYEKTVVTTGSVAGPGDRPLLIIRIGDHTDDGIAILDRKERLLFAGDEFMPGRKGINRTVEEWRDKLLLLLPFRGDFDRICGGPCILPAEVFDINLEAAEALVSGKAEGVKKEASVKRPGGFAGEPLYEGHKVYDCQMPHPEDRHVDMQKGESRVLTYTFKGWEFTYDRDRLRKAGAEEGKAELMTAFERLGDSFLYGNLGEPDYDKAFFFLEKARLAGSKHALASLGIMYKNGFHVEKDIEKAKAYLKEAMAFGDMKAPRHLAFLADSDAEAAEYFRIAAERGDITGQYELGRRYELGQGVGKDLDEAIRWYRKSAERGDRIARPAMDALIRLGVKD